MSRFVPALPARMIVTHAIRSERLGACRVGYHIALCQCRHSSCRSDTANWNCQCPVLGRRRTRLTATHYGQRLLFKIALFVAMVYFAAINRHYLAPELSIRVDDPELGTRAVPILATQCCF
jgi:hypothetical protein